MQRIAALVWVGLITSAVPAAADWTARASILFNSPGDLRVSSGERFVSSLDDGVGYGLAIGYDFPLLRAEIEGLYFRNDLAGAAATGFAITDGEVDRLMAFGNVFVDLPLAPFFSVYGGAGVGFAKADMKVGGSGSPGGSGAESFRWSDSETVLGYQLMAGLRFGFTRFFASAGYRYLHLADADLSSGISTAALRGGDHVWEISAGFSF